MPKKKATNRPVMTYPTRAAEVPTTQGMLYGVRDELKSDIRSLEFKVDSRFEKMTAEIHRIGLLVEEQNAKNNIVLDGLTSLFARQERIETKIDDSQRG